MSMIYYCKQAENAQVVAICDKWEEGLERTKKTLDDPDITYYTNIGEFEYGEGEYLHNCETIWPGITYGEEDHWCNNMYSTFSCTHSIGPLIHITGLRPVSVIGLETTRSERRRRVGGKSAAFGMEMITLENGGIIKSIHGGLYNNSIWYTVYGSHGRMESGREDTGENVERLYINADEYSGEYAGRDVVSYKPAEKNAEGRRHGRYS